MNIIKSSFCLVDLLKTLRDGESFFVPSPEYGESLIKRIDDFNVFERSNNEVFSSFDNLQFTEDKMNISISYSIGGKVKLNPEDSKILKSSCNVDKDGFIFTNVFINQFLVEDSIKQMEELECHVNEETLSKIPEYLITKKRFNVNIYDFDYTNVVINIKDLPIINGEYIIKSDDLNDIMLKVTELETLQIKQKVYKYLIDRFNVDKVIKNDKWLVLTGEESQILKSYGLDNYLVFKGNTINTYTNEENAKIKEIIKFLFILEGWGTIPKIDNTIKKYKEIEEYPNSKKKLNETELLIKSYIDNIDNIEKMETDMSKSSIPLLLDKSLKNIKRRLIDVKTELSIFKLAKVINNDWWNLPTEVIRGREYYVYESNNKRLLIIKYIESV